MARRNAVARKVGQRIRATAAERGLVLDPYRFSGPRWTLPRQQFQALYKKVGSFEEAKRLAGHIVTTPTDDDGIPMELPYPHIIRRWAYEYDVGEADIPPRIERVMSEKLTAMRMSGLWRTLETVSGALETMSRKSADGKLEQPVQSQLLSLGNAFNYGMGSLAQMEKQINGQSNPTLNLTGRLSLNAGPPPKKVKVRTLKDGTQKIIDAKFSEVPIEQSTG